MVSSVSADRGRVDLSDCRLEFAWFGDVAGAQRTVVLLHEGLGSLTMWRDFPADLAVRTAARVLAYSRPGYGASSPLKGKREPDYMHREAEVVLPELLEALDVRRPDLLGHSDGASIALIFASAHPANVGSLILEAPHVFVEDLTVDSIAEARIAYQTTDLPRKLARYHADPDAAFWGWNDIWLDPRFRAWNIEARLPAIGCPILMIQGLQDQYGTAAQLEAIRKGVSGDASIVMLDGCGHAPHRDQPEQTLAAIDRHLRLQERQHGAGTA
jgi:pimeloyl-ACP methyl ester carboxylesterase